MALKGSRQLRARLKAIRQVFKPIGKDWADATVPEAKRRTPVQTGETRASVKRRFASQQRAAIFGKYTYNFLIKGTKEHDISPKNFPYLAWKDGGMSVFAKKVHKRAQAPRLSRREIAEAGLKKVPLAKRVVDLWNRAA